MSRSSFALAFHERVGETPMSYLTRWRMLLAADRLAKGELVSTIAPDLGYASESAFSTAFKRVMRSSPRAFGVATRSDRRDASSIRFVPSTDSVSGDAGCAA